MTDHTHSLRLNTFNPRAALCKTGSGFAALERVCPDGREPRFLFLIVRAGHEKLACKVNFSFRSRGISSLDAEHDLQMAKPRERFVHGVSCLARLPAELIQIWFSYIMLSNTALASCISSVEKAHSLTSRSYPG